MKFKKSLSLAVAVLGLSLAGASALSPQYVTKTGASGSTGTGVKNTTVIFPADLSGTSLQVRLVGLIYNSDTNNGNFSIQTGTTPYAPLGTNSSSATTLWINSTNGMTVGDTLWLQQANGYFTNAIIASYTSNSLNTAYSPTNITLASGGWGVGMTLGDTIFENTASNSIPALQGTNSYQGEAIYVGNPGRPVLVQLGPGWKTNQIITATARYE